MKNKKIIISLIAIFIILIFIGIILVSLKNNVSTPENNITSNNNNKNNSSTNNSNENSQTNNNSNSNADSILDSAYIDIWKSTALNTEPDLFSTGTGSDTKLYLGSQPLHYLINKNGDVHTYQDSSFQNELTGERDPATITYIKTLSQSELVTLENDLKSAISSNASNNVTYSSWYIKIDGNQTKVDMDLKSNILNNYLPK